MLFHIHPVKLYHLISLVLMYIIPFLEDTATFTVVLRPMMMRHTFHNSFCSIVIAKKAVLAVLSKANKQKMT